MIGIIAAMDVEMEALVNLLSNHETSVIAGLEYHKGVLNETDVVICKCGVGKVNAAMHTQALIDRFSPSAIIQTGLAGSLQEKVQQLDLVIGSELVYHDMQDFVIKNFDPLEEVYYSDKALLEKVIEVAGTESVHVGRIATGDLFVASKDTKTEILNKTGALCAEMEGCAVAHTAFLNEVPFVVIRSISDTADDSASIDFDKFQTIAAECLVDIIVTLVKSI